MKSTVTIVLCALFFRSSFSQDIVEPKHTYNIEIGLPITVANKSFKSIMTGVVHASTYYQFRFPFNFTVGAGGSFSLISVNSYKVKPSVKGSISTLGAFVKIGHEKFHSETFGTDYGLKIGYNQVTFKDTLLTASYGKDNYSIGVLTMTPMVTFRLMADGANSYGFAFGYTFQDFNFFPARLGYPEQSYYDETMSRGSTQTFTVGFSYTHYIGRKAEE